MNKKDVPPLGGVVVTLKWSVEIIDFFVVSVGIDSKFSKVVGPTAAKKAASLVNVIVLALTVETANNIALIPATTSPTTAAAARTSLFRRCLMVLPPFWIASCGGNDALPA
jgi:hypothetical protein